MSWLIIYVVALFYFSLRGTRPGMPENEYYVCGRSASAYGVAFSIIASCVGGSATIGMIGLAWEAGWPAFWWLGSGAAGLVILGLFLARHVRESGALTMPEIISRSMGRPCRLTASAIILVAWLAILAAQLSALGLIVAAITPLDTAMSTAFGAAFLLLYTCIGGQPAVMKSDIWQLAILLAALALALFFAFGSPSAHNVLPDAPLEAFNAQFPLSRLRYFLCILGGSYIVCPMLFGRILSARDAGSARKGVLLAAMGLALIACLIVIVGIGCRGLVPAGTAAQDVLASFARDNVPPWAFIIIMIGLFSAIVSSADSCLLTAAGVAARDLTGRQGTAWCRAWMVLLTIAGCLLASQGNGILSLLLMANDIYVCGIVCPVFVGIVFGESGRLNPVAMLAAICAGGCLGLGAAATGSEQLALAGVCVSLGISLAGMLMPCKTAGSFPQN